MLDAGERGFLFRIRLLAGISLVCLILAAWIAWRFVQASDGFPIWNLIFGTATPADIAFLRDMLLLPERREAAVLLFWLYAGPDLILPACLGALGLLSMRRLAPGGTLFGRPISGGLLTMLLALPFIYVIADYAENALSLAYFSTAVPLHVVMENAPRLLPWLGSAKMVFFLVSALVIMRFLLLQRFKENDVG
ncbi:hypothetical protein LJR030_000756 [Rhizobium sp. LjRoot30]|uniref:hypothetical protein n=1 Tax=Rhizobium sp. LjRoot30 TaxID=3342320 RepID=UPI003ECCE747